MRIIIFISWILGCLNVCGDDRRMVGLWVDAYHTGIGNTAEVGKLVRDVRTANANAIFVEVRKRGDAYYNSRFEPKARGIAPDYDPLADLIAQAHATNDGPRIEVHVWMIVYPVWNGAAGVPETNHPYLKHSDWLSRDLHGNTYDGRYYAFDPGHPDAQSYLFNVAMDIVSKYDVDGLQLDYIHYSGKDWGYNAKAVDRFNKRFNRKGQPSPSDPHWMQFRRDQVTSLLRKIYLSVTDLKPKVKVSAATITWPPPPANEEEWLEKSSAYTRVYQDWLSWMKEGILDVNIPMVYSPHDNPGYHRLYSTWVGFATEHRYNRHVVISPSLYMNSLAGSVAQIREALAPGKTGKGADGVCLYSYASYPSDAANAEDFFRVLSHGLRSKGEVPVFPTFVAPPEMPWKTHPTAGHVKGFVREAGSTNCLDGANVIVKGPVNRTLLSDGTGFYGSVDLLPGDYVATVTFDGYAEAKKTFTVTKGAVSTVDVELVKTK